MLNNQFIGRRFSRLVAISQFRTNKTTFVVCLCDCGQKRTVRQGNLTGNRTKSCGCLFREISQIRPLNSVKAQNPKEYSIWRGMRRRCHNPKDKGYKNYGGRGITICDRWIDFKAFLADMGSRPSPKHSIDRIENNGNYEPDNCRWATRDQQSNNTRQNVKARYESEILTLAQIAKKLGVCRQAISNRVKKYGLENGELPIKRKGGRPRKTVLAKVSSKV